MGFETFTVINCYDILDSNNRLICKHCKILKVKVYESGSDKIKGWDSKQDIEHRYCNACC